MRIPLVSLLLLIPLCSLLLSLDIDVVSCHCLDDQLSLLLQIKSNLKFDPSIIEPLERWDRTSDCCTWDEVTCDGVGHVIGLDLHYKVIMGASDYSSLFSLQHLEFLDLSTNNFSSRIPTMIGNLTKLTNLKLSNAGFKGSIPIEISLLKRLIILDLSNSWDNNWPFFNSLTLENSNLSMLFQNFSQIEELYLDGMPISSRGSEWCQALSSSLPNLRVLSLSNCLLSGPIDQSPEKLRSLSVIHLEGNNFSAVFPGFIANISNLTSLHLNSCGLHGTFPRDVFKLPKLQIVDISKNKLLQGSLPEFSRNTALQILDLSSTSFSGMLPSSIGNLRNLSKLALYCCNFTGLLPNSMTKLTQLVELDLSSNNFIGQIPSFNMSKKLTSIDLSYNGLTGEISTTHWESLSNLVEINLRNNFLNGSIPLSLFELPSLNMIHLSENQFSGTIPEFQTASPSTLYFLALSRNNLEGPLPNSFLKLKGLRFFLLSHNKFNGSINLECILQELVQIQRLDLSFNNLSLNSSGNFTSAPSLPYFQELFLASCNLTNFPLYLKNLYAISTLDLSHNKINGEIPNWIWELENLVSLNLSYNNLVGIQEPYSLPQYINSVDLHNNKLRGKIPFLPPYVLYVDLSSNNFASSIPVDTIIPSNGTSMLTFLSLSNNSLTGVIPESLCYATTLFVLDLSGNNLSGEIPTCVTQMSKTLVILNLGRNNFGGPIHHNAFPSNCRLKSLDLNRNIIQGEVPKSLANCKSLELLDLGHNIMIDQFPCFLRKISSLRVLVLRSHKFYGRTDCVGTNGTWSMLQIFDLAYNNFSGKLPGEMLTKSQAMITNKDDVEVLGYTEGSNESDDTEMFFVHVSANYRDAVTVTFKGLEVELLKIQTFFTYIDLSCNNFHGGIPEEVGLLKALRVLNLSNNAFTSEIPSSIGNLLQLDSLDLSRNNLSGPIPPSLASLSFLSFLNLSFNNLVGRIPKGNQFQTFSANSFIGNEELCGFPLNNCTSESPSPNATDSSDSNSGRKINWDLLSPEIGFIVGFGIVVGPLMFSKRWRKWHYELVDDIIFRIFPSSVSRKWVLWTTSR